MEGKKPIEVFKAGGIRAAVWENTIKRNGQDIVVHSVQIDRTYKDGDEWKRTSRFDARDLPKVALVARKAFEYLALKRMRTTWRTSRSLQAPGPQGLGANGPRPTCSFSTVVQQPREQASP